MNMKSLFLCLLGALGAVAAPFSFGVRGGVPLTDFINSVETGTSPVIIGSGPQTSALGPGLFGITTTTNRYIIGPTVELHLPAGFGIEFDALYRHLNYNATGNLTDVAVSSRTSSNAWEFPLLLKYRFPTPIVKPYVDAGVAWDTLSGLKQTVTATVLPTHITTTNSTSSPAELHHNTVTGFVVGVGLDVHAIFVHISPEIRYTRWGAQHFLPPGIPGVTNGLPIESDQNQAEFLLGITF